MAFDPLQNQSSKLGSRVSWRAPAASGLPSGSSAADVIQRVKAQLLGAGEPPPSHNSELAPKLSPRFLKQLDTLKSEQDPELFYSGLLHLGRELRSGLEEAGALKIFQFLVSEDTVPKNLKHQAQKEFQAITGQSSVGFRLEYLGTRFIPEATDYKMILPMLLGTAVGSLVKAATSVRLANTLGMGGKVLPSVLGFAAEAPAFALSSRALHQMAGEPVREDVGADIASAGITLGAMKVFGGLASKGHRYLQQPATFAGLYSANKIEERFGLRNQLADATTITDILGSMVSLGVGGHLGNKFLQVLKGALKHEVALSGQSFRILQVQASEIASQEKNLLPAQAGTRKKLFLLNPIFSPLWAAMGAGGIGGGGKDKEPPKAGKTPRISSTSSEREQLWEVVNKDLQNMELRQVYGDLLQELGDPRGELITLQIRGSQTREQELRQKKLETQFFQEFSRRLSLKKSSGYKFEGGFLKEISLTRGLEEETLRKLLNDEEEPFIRGLYLYGVAFRLLERFPEISELHKLTLLSLGKISPSGFAALIGSRYLSNLTHLSLKYPNNFGGIGAEGALALADSPHLSKLTHLDLYYNRIGTEGARALASSPHLSNLTHLNLNSNDIGAQGVRALALSSYLSKLTHLDLYNNRIGTEGARALASSPHLSNLTHLNLNSNDIGAQGVRALALSSYLSKLTHLDLSHNRIGAEGVRALASSPHLSKLTHLNLTGNDIGTEGARALAWSPHLTNLTHLDLEFFNIDAEGVRALASSPHLSNLTHLNLFSNDIGAEGARALASSPHLSNLTHLDLSYNDIGAEGARALATSPHLSNLTHLGRFNLDDLRREEHSENTQNNEGNDSLRAIPAPALIGLDCLLNGHPTLLGALVTAASLLPLAHSAMRLGNFSETLGKLKTFGREIFLCPLKKLVLGRNQIGDAGRRALAESPYLSEEIRNHFK